MPIGAGSEVKVAIVGDASQLAREMAKANGALDGFGTSAKRAGDLARATLFGGAMVAGAKYLIDSAIESQRAMRETERVIQTTGASSWTTAAHIAGLGDQLSKLTGIDDEVIQKGENVLLTFTNIQNKVGEGNDIFDRGTRAALDLSVAMSQDLQSSVVQVGKALNDPIKGMTALQRIGVSFTEDQKKLVASLVATGDVLGAQKIILAELEKEFGGAAAAAAQPLDQLKVSIGNLAEALGGALLPAVNVAAGGLQFLVDGFLMLPPPVQAATVGFAALVTVGPKVVEMGAAIVGTIRGIPSMMESVALKAMYAGDSMGKVATGASSLIGALGPAGLMGVTAGLAIGVGVLAYAWQQGEEDARRNREASASLTEELKRQGGAVAEVTNEWLINQLATGEAGDRFQNLGESVYKAGLDLNDFIYGVRESGTALDAMRDATYGTTDANGKLVEGMDSVVPLLEEAAAGGADWAQALLDASAAGTLHDDALIQIIRDMDWANDRTDEGTASYNLYKAILEATTGATEGQTGATQDGTAATEANTGATDENVKALERQYGALQDLIGAEQSAESAHIASQRALENYNKVMADSTSTDLDKQEALQRLESAAQNEANAIANSTIKTLEAAGANVTAAQKNDILIEAYRRVQGTTKPGSPLWNSIEGYIGLLMKTPEQRKTEFDAQVYLAAMATAAYQNLIKKTPTDWWTVFHVKTATPPTNLAPPPGSTYVGLDGKTYTRWTGTIGVTDDAPYLVGEHGPEIITGVRGRGIIDAPSTNQMMRNAGRSEGGGGGGGNVSIHIGQLVLPDVQSPEQMVEGLLRYVRKNGPLPARVVAT